jgi:hypothetical protein
MGAGQAKAGKKRRIAATAVLAAGGLLLSACWLPAPLPQPPAGIPVIQLQSLTCTSSDFCLATGLDGGPPPPNNVFGQPFFDVLNGSWSLVSPPYPGNADGELADARAASCSATGSCVAVGNYEVGANNAQGLIETLNAGSWSASEAPLPASARTDIQQASLSEISCAPSGTCIAIGQFSGPTSSQWFIDTRSNGTWTPTTPVPPGGSINPPTLEGVSCGPTGACVVVGSYDATSPAGQMTGLIEELSSSGTWSASVAPIPTNATIGNAQLQDVSCWSADNCMAIGSYFPPAAESDLFVETLSAGSWTASQAPLPGDVMTTSAGLAAWQSLACASDGACGAAGIYKNTAGNQVPFGDTMTSQGTWTASAIPLPPGANESYGSETGAISCEPGTSCMAIGSYHASSATTSLGFVSSTFNGSWSTEIPPLPAGGNAALGFGVSSVSCPSIVECFIDGTYSNGSSSGPLLMVAPDIHFNLLQLTTDHLAAPSTRR